MTSVDAGWEHTLIMKPRGNDGNWEERRNLLCGRKDSPSLSRLFNGMAWTTDQYSQSIEFDRRAVQERANCVIGLRSITVCRPMLDEIDEAKAAAPKSFICSARPAPAKTYL
jgi:hypothetical protein